MTVKSFIRYDPGMNNHWKHGSQGRNNNDCSHYCYRVQYIQEIEREKKNKNNLI